MNVRALRVRLRECGRVQSIWRLAWLLVLCVCVFRGQEVCCSFGLRLLRLPQRVRVSRSSPKDWAVFIGSHMQQEVVISFDAPTSRRTCLQMDCASTEMQNTNCNNFTSGNHVRGARFNAYFALSRRPQRGTARLNPEFSKLATITPHMRKLLAHACETRVLRPAGRPGRTC